MGLRAGGKRSGVFLQCFMNKTGEEGSKYKNGEAVVVVGLKMGGKGNESCLRAWIWVQENICERWTGKCLWGISAIELLHHNAMDCSLTHWLLNTTSNDYLHPMLSYYPF
jgi:hypothetical protein